MHAGKHSHVLRAKLLARGSLLGGWKGVREVRCLVELCVARGDPLLEGLLDISFGRCRNGEEMLYVVPEAVAVLSCCLLAHTRSTQDEGA